MSIVVGVLFLLGSVLSASDGPISPLFGVQIHSWNDIREWPAMFHKGVTSFKIDVHYVTDASLCEFQKQASTPCLMMHHDLPSKEAQFYSVYDGLEYLAK